jgi:hypothetical protein
MKKLITISLFAALLTTGNALKAQQEPKEYLGLPGDNLNLYAVMDLFQNSETLEDFERDLNDPQSNINNLDLNGDNLVDYLTVVDNVNNNVHNIVIRDQIGRNEIQDVAVFTVQRFSNGQVQIQLTGDEALYGRNYIIEPIFDNPTGTPNPGYTGNTTIVNGRTVTVVTTTPVQIATWPLIRFIYSPNYVIWRSSWYWGNYPHWWRPWRPYYWDYYYGYHHNLFNRYYVHYRRWDTHRYSHWHDFYYSSYHSHSPVVYSRIKSGAYKKTYSRPDQRRAGEKAYMKTYNPQNRRTNVSRNTGSNTRMEKNYSRQAKPAVSTNRSTGRNTRMEKNYTRPVKPAVSTSRTTVTRRTTTGVTNTGRSVSGQNSNNRKETHVTPQRSFNRTTVTRKTTRTEVRNNGNRSSSGRSASVSKSSGKSNNAKASKASRVKKNSSATKKKDDSKPARRR